MIELVEGIFFAPEHVAMVRASGKEKCLLYFIGQSPSEGHPIPFSASQVAQVIEDALTEDSECFDEEGEDD